MDFWYMNFFHILHANIYFKRELHLKLKLSKFCQNNPKFFENDMKKWSKLSEKLKNGIIISVGPADHDQVID